MKSQEETESIADKRYLKLDLLKGLCGYKEGAHLVGYLAKFERVMQDCLIPEETWPEWPLPTCLRY